MKLHLNTIILIVLFLFTFDIRKSYKTVYFLKSIPKNTTQMSKKDFKKKLKKQKKNLKTKKNK